MNIWDRIKGCTRSRVLDPQVRVGFTQFPARLSDEGYLTEWNRRVDANLARRAAEKPETCALLRPQA